jgi:hypothetical protein
VANAVYGSTGRLHGHYIYALQCSDPERFLIKIGISVNPLARMDQIRTGCPLTPELLATMHFISKEDAVVAESMFHVDLAKFRLHGEWFAIPKCDRTSFNVTTAKVRGQLARPTWPLRWVKINAGELIAAKKQTQGFIVKRLARRGLAYRDALRAGMKPLR